MIPSQYQVEDPNAERIVLTTVWNEPLARKFISGLFPQLFVNQINAVIFVTLRDMVEKNEPFEATILSAKLTGKMRPTEVMEFVIDEKVLTQEAFEWNARRLRDLYYSRVALNVASKINKFALENDVRSVIRSADSLNKVHSALYGREITTDHFHESVNVINSQEELIPTSFKKLNSLIGGFTRGDISAIGGKPGHNKSTFTTYDAVQSIKMGYADKILYFAVDEGGDKVARRIIASELDISLSQMRSKQVKLDANETSAAIKKILGNRFIIIDNAFDADRIFEAICDIRPSRAIIDHIQELNYGDEGISDTKVTVASQKLKRAAKIANANVTILSQVRDKLVDERYDDKLPRPHDFLYGSDLRRKAREQCVVYWEFKDTQKDVDYPFFDFVIWKSTYSETGKFKLMIDPDKARFYEKGASREIVDRPKSESEVWDKIGRL